MKIIELLLKSISPILFNFWGAVAGGAFNLAGSAINSAVQASENHKARKWAEEMRDYDNWYNSPEQQIQRLKDAGLNPAMLMQNPTAGGTAASAPSPSGYGRPLNAGQGMKEVGAIFSNIQQLDQQLEGMQHDNDLKKIAVESAQEDLDKKRNDNERDRFNRDNNLWQTDADIKRNTLRKLEDEHNIAVANLNAIKDDNQRKNYAEQRLQEVHKEWQNNAFMRQELQKHEHDLRMKIISNEKFHAQVIEQLNKDGFRPDEVLDGKLTYSKLTALVQAVYNLQQYRNLSQHNLVNEVKRLLLPASAVPGLGSYVTDVIDYLDTY